MHAPPDNEHADNFFSRSAHGMAQSFSNAAAAGTDQSRLRSARIGAQGAWVEHLPCVGFAPPVPAIDAQSPEAGVFMLCGCSYLSAPFWPETVAAAHHAIDTYGVGTYGSAPLSGETHYHEQVKQALVDIYRPADGVAFLTVSASLANITALPMLVGHGDTIFADAQSHMTLIQGFMLSQARVQRFAHNDLLQLERQLIAAQEQDPTHAHRRLIVSDGVFSMSGHVCNLPRLVALAGEYHCRLLIDEAHALGALGPRGRGTADYWGMDPACIDVITGTLAKAVGAQDGYIVCSDALAKAVSYEYATNRVFSSGIPASIAAAAVEVLHQINAWDELQPPVPATTFSQMYARQQRNTQIMRSHLRLLRERGIDTEPDALPGPIQRIVVGDQQKLFAIQMRLYQRGVYVVGVVYPAVPKGQDQFRITVMPAFSPAQMEYCARTITEVVSEVFACS